MKIIAHRGLWESASEQNTLEAMGRALAAGFGLETDLWSVGAHGLISHNSPRLDRCVHLDQVLRLPHAPDAILALNIKSDDVAPLLSSRADQLATWEWYAFDMSIPETIRIADAELPFLRRVSSLEPMPVELLGSGLWVDCFQGAYPEHALKSHDIRRVFVSPELHKYRHETAWAELREADSCSRLMALCTDYPLQADQFFNGSEAPT